MSAFSTNMAIPHRHLAGIHALRGLAAFMVLLSHLHYVGQIPLPQSWYFVATHGGGGVELFYVLSAFSLLYSNQKYVLSVDLRSLFEYLVKRFFRIAPLFYVMLVVHCLLILYIFNGKLDVQRIVMSVLFIFNLAPEGAEGVVWASWSIGVEMVFYAFLPLVLVSVRSLRAASVLWGMAILSSYMYRRGLEVDPWISSGYEHYAFLSHLGVFGGGILGYWIFDRSIFATKAMRRCIWWFSVMFGPVMAIFLLHNTSRFLVAPGRPDLQLWGLSFGCIAVLSAVSDKRWLAHPVLQYFGERSYSIYLMHAVIIYFSGPLLRRLYDFCYVSVGGYGFAICALAVLLPTLLVSEMSYRLVEVRGIALGRKILTTRGGPGRDGGRQDAGRNCNPNPMWKRQLSE